MPAHPIALPQRILIIRLSAHGDVVQTLPLLSCLRQMFPSATVGWLVERSAEPLLRGNPSIDVLHVSDRKTWMKNLWRPWRWAAIWRGWKGLVQEIRAQKYDVAIDVQGLLKSALWLPVSGAPRKLGYKATREFADRMYTETILPLNLQDPSTPAAYQFIRFAEYLAQKHGLPFPESPPLAYPLPSQEDSQCSVEQWMSPIPAHWPVVVLAPHTAWTSKFWGLSQWQGFLNDLFSRPIGVVLVGGPEAVGYVRQMTDPILENKEWPSHWVNLVGKTSWTELMGVFRSPRVRGMIGPDSAPLHLANAVAFERTLESNVPPMAIWGLYGPTAPGRTGPTHPRAQVFQNTHLPCVPCYEKTCPLATRACMEELGFKQVLEAVVSHITESPPERGLVSSPMDKVEPH